ncbi:MAG TPA: efflux transporter outer membrane subunit [Rhizomicrobium sp.]|nr:efflux transporter outer membrane subunit [Rhizomicrobium sp.]
MRKSIVMFGLVPLLAACAVGPDYKRPPLPASAGYGGEAVSPPGGAGTELMSGADIPAQWWEVFHSAALDDLVAQALKNNPTIDAADAALRAAREEVRAEQGAFYPSLTGSIQPSRVKNAETLASPTLSGEQLYNLTTTTLSISYSPDLFGGTRRTVESLVAQEDQQQFTLEAARLTLASNVVLAAIQDALLREQIEQTHAIIRDQQQTYATFEQQAKLGQTSQVDLAAQAALLAQSEATLPVLEKQFRINRDLLTALIGRTPAEPVTVQFDFQSLSLPTQLPLSLPAQLVEHRPDVRIAEEQLHSASAQIGIAVAARLPNIDIGITGGSAALGLVPAFDSTNEFWSLAATLTQPIFNGNTLLHRQRAAEALYDQAAAQYRLTLVGAFQNTADTLHAIWTDGDELVAMEKSETAARTSLDIANRQLNLGDVSRLVVLTAEETEAQARLALIQARANRYSDAVALFQALGGGWWNRETHVAADAEGARQ